MIISPYDIALYYLDSVLDMDFYSSVNEDGKLSAGQVSTLKSSGFITDQMIVSVNNMLKDLAGSANIDDIKWTDNIRNRLVMNIVPVVMEEIDSTLSNGSHIKWLPSFAAEIDPIHALNYGHVMTWSTAKKKELGTRFGCKCGFEVVNSANIKPIEQKLTVEGVNLVEKTQ
jgi:hypothetical protein